MSLYGCVLPSGLVAGGCGEKPAERRAVRMAFVRAAGGVPEAVPKAGQLSDGAIQLAGLCRQQRPVDLRLTLRTEDGGDLVEGEAGDPAERDQREALDDLRLVLAAKPAPALRPDQPALLIVAKRRGWQTGRVCNLADVQKARPPAAGLCGGCPVGEAG